MAEQRRLQSPEVVIALNGDAGLSASRDCRTARQIREPLLGAAAAHRMHKCATRLLKA
jgi:hypothetical protein